MGYEKNDFNKTNKQTNSLTCHTRIMLALDRPNGNGWTLFDFLKWSQSFMDGKRGLWQFHQLSNLGLNTRWSNWWAHDNKGVGKVILRRTKLMILSLFKWLCMQLKYVQCLCCIKLPHTTLSTFYIILNTFYHINIIHTFFCQCGYYVDKIKKLEIYVIWILPQGNMHDWRGNLIAHINVVFSNVIFPMIWHLLMQRNLEF
jgi:hypothetical protein